MSGRFTLVVTSIAPPTPAARAFAEGALRSGQRFLLVGDEGSPPSYELEGCEFVSLEAQRELPFRYARLCPTRHYARKNLGYLLAVSGGAACLRESDDDNLPLPDYWEPRSIVTEASLSGGGGWHNVYARFTAEPLWPRGFPLERLPGHPSPAADSSPIRSPIQQGLADGDPDLDAVFRLTRRLPPDFRFDTRAPVALAAGSWCPFNSQNTAWWPEAYPLLYLPATCSFRATDIFRSFVAQRVLWEQGGLVTFHRSDVRQLRNAHDLLADFRQEIPVYLNADRIRRVLEGLSLRSGRQHAGRNLGACYEALVAEGIFDRGEISLLEAWIEDIGALAPGQPGEGAAAPAQGGSS